LCLDRALRAACRTPEHTAVLIADTPGLTDHDDMEAQAARSVWGNGYSNLRITASKLVTGHLLYAAGAIDAALAALCLFHRMVPPAGAPENMHPSSKLSLVAGGCMEIPAASAAVVNSMGLAGQNAAL